MATQYPNNLDNFSNPTSLDNLNSVTVPHATQHANLNDAVEAIEATLGLSPQGGYSSVKTRIENIENYVSVLTGSSTYIQDEVMCVSLGDETTTITTATPAVTFRMPFAMTLTSVRASLTTASSSGTPTFDINESGSSILSTKLTIDANEKTSTTATTPAVLSDTLLADDAEITIDIDVAGTNAVGAKIYLIGYRT